MAALIRTDCNALHVLLDCGINDFSDAAVVTEMNDLGTGCLQKASNNVDRGVVAIKKTRRGDKAHAVIHDFFGTRLLRESGGGR